MPDFPTILGFSSCPYLRIVYRKGIMNNTLQWGWNPLTLEFCLHWKWCARRVSIPSYLGSQPSISPFDFRHHGVSEKIRKLWSGWQDSNLHDILRSKRSRLPIWRSPWKYWLEWWESNPHATSLTFLRFIRARVYIPSDSDSSLSKNMETCVRHPSLKVFYLSGICDRR